jgi:putative PIN family toxin of toxin-antitoxin system
MRVVIDTNVIISGLNFPGKEREVLDLARLGRFEFYLSPFILVEVSSVLCQKFGWSENLADAAVRMLANWAVIVEPEMTVSRIKRNDADNRILECAVKANGDFLVTGDRRDLLPLKQFQNTRIVSSSQFLSILDVA